MVSQFQQNETTYAPLVPVQLVYQALYYSQPLFKLYNQNQNYSQTKPWQDTLEF